MLELLPIKQELETKEVLKKAISANKTIEELNNTAKIIPNSWTLINSLGLQEAKDSSEIENIVTTQDELYRASLFVDGVNSATKEVQDYQKAMIKCVNLVSEYKFLSTNHIVKIQKYLHINGDLLQKISKNVSVK